MNFNITTPCKNCPFRTDRPSQEGWLGEDRATEIMEAISDLQQSFPCHKTTEATLGERADPKNEQHCAGALIMLEKLERPNQMMRIAERLGFYNRHGLDMEAPVFDDPDDFISWHGGDRE